MATTTFEALPEELVVRILAAVPCLPRVRDCTLVCSTWRRLVGDKAAMGGNPCVGKWHVCGVKLMCRQLGAPYKYTVTLTDQASAVGHVACLEYAQTRGHEPIRFACLLAASRGRTGVLDWLVARGRPDEYADDLRTPALSDAAIRSGSIECLERVLSLGAVLSQATACETAAAAGHLSMLAHLHAKGCAWTDDVCRQATVCGSIDCLVYAHQSGLSLGLCDVRHAIQRHRNDVVMYLWANGREPTAECMDTAAKHDNLGCFAYAHVAGISFDACDWETVVKSYRVEIARYACAHGWTPTAPCLVAAASAGQREMVRCLVDHGGCRPDVDVLVAAVKSRSTSTVGYLLDIGCPGHKRVCGIAILNGNVEMLRYAHRRGCPWDMTKCRSWAGLLKKSQGRRAMLQYLDEHWTCADGQCNK
ncbi:Ankyrin repeat incomplete domain containing protein [Pandoravirus quercus]|uniref:Ankyrin repeat incomplete domain containing protein n=1 Tax=Pandoravirus quercus TaxID=2107709 RepID=A0A2U7U9W5_9VIRU|nr:Ankyrin repeat incomplete domain containing protein [Pandoravirus quercus]AVK75175.1 Ankyrin repeat incomplete domain containing protein [Pandoravirus quercus]